MASQRIKGQEVEVLVLVNGQVQNTLLNNKSFEFMMQTETLEEGYLGEKTDRYDEIFKGFSGSGEFDNSEAGLSDFFLAIQNRAARRNPGTIVNIKATLNYPNGDRKRWIFQDCFFDPMGLSFGGRDQYGSTKLDFKCSNARPL